MSITEIAPDGPARAEQDFKRALRHFASGVTVVTTSDEADCVHGMTATAFCSLSLKPPLILVAVAEKTRCHARILAAKRFGISILFEHHADLSRHFGGRPMALEPRYTILEGVPVVADAMVNLSCVLDRHVPAGDHSIVIGAVVATLTVPGLPLLHFDGGYRAMTPLG